MQFAFEAFGWLVNSTVLAQAYLTAHPVIGFGVVAFLFLWVWTRDFSRSKTFLLSCSGYTVIDGKFSKGKTRMLTLVASEAKKRNMFVLCNWYNDSEDVRWNSKKDLIRIMEDMWLIGEYQNYTEADIRKMYEKEGKKRVAEKIATFKKLSKRYKNIPRGGFHTRFWLGGDEMQNIFYNRESISNFAGENKPLLKLLHQVRHFNAQGMFALTDASEFDKKFRKISSYYVSFKDTMNELFIKYDVFSFETDRENNLDLERANRLTKATVWKLNGYVANKMIAKIETKIRRRIPYRFKELGFFSKFNCDPDVDIYESGHLLKYLDKWYETHPNFLQFQYSNE